ncbi:MAG: hypothetical protein QOF35_2207 [Actinomycetota bacterium]|nr:hypothetical protein [Actinomycetota bacterium]
MAVNALSRRAESAARSHPDVLPLATRVVAVCCLFGAEAIHTAVIQEHIDEWLPIGLFFLTISIVEGFLAVALIIEPSRWLIRVIVVVSLGTVSLWLYTRTLGLPIGPMAGSVEAMGRLDIICSVLEVVTAAALLLRPRQRNQSARRGSAA